MIDTQSIRAKILDLAMRGRLTEQLPEDGTAEDLYQQIQEEKQELVKAGKIKKEKQLPEISANEIPFTIPNSWKWVRIGAAFCVEMGQSPDGSSVSKNGEGIEFHQGKIYFGDKYLNDSGQRTTKPSKFAEANSVLLCVRAPVGKVNITDRRICIGRGLSAISPVAGVIVDFLFYSLVTCEKSFVNRATGSTFVAIGGNVIKNQLIPLPPITEQQRIVDKINQLISELNTIDELQAQYRTNLTALQSKLLDAAIQGKLTKQLPEDGTAEELFQKIQEEKQALIKAGKIKKEKALAEITNDEIPFEIPDSWIWVRLSNLMLLMSTGPFGSMLHKSDYIENGIPVINPANIVDGSIIPSTKMQISMETKSRLIAYELHEGMIVMGRRGEMGRCAVVGPAEDGWLCGTGSFFMKPSSEMCSDFVSLIISSPYSKAFLSGQSIGMTMDNLNQSILQSMPVPLPPLAEQTRIMEKLHVVYKMLEN